MIASTIRNLRRAPGFVAIAAISLGLALGLSTAVFAFIDAMQHPASAIRSVDDTYSIGFPNRFAGHPEQHEVDSSVKKMPMIESMAGYRGEYSQVEVSDRMTFVSLAYTRVGFWELLGVHARIGRLPSTTEANAVSVAVVSDALWKSEFANQATIGPAKVIVEGREYGIVGVLPPTAKIVADIFIPDSKPETQGAWVVRLKPRADTAALKALLKGEAARFTRMYKRPTDRYGAYFWVTSLRPDPLELHDYHRAIIGSAIAILLIACANVAALMLARGMVRRRDYALQLALGAPARRIFREVLAEVVGLTVIGCVIGAVVAAWTVSLITKGTPEQLRWMGFVAPQWSLRLLAQMTAAVFVSVAVAGGFPAWRASRIDPAGPLKESSGGNTGRISTRFRLLVMAELALSMTLMVSTSLMMKSVRQLEHYDFGYDARGLSSSFYWRRFFGRDTTLTFVRQSNQAILDVVRAMPVIRGAATTTGCYAKRNMLVSDRTTEGGGQLYLANRIYGNDGCRNVSGQFFTTLGIPLLKGRDFSDSDAESGGAVILDEKTARALFPHDEPVGRQVRLGGAQDTELPWLPVIGVVGDRRLGFNHYPEMGPDSGMLVYVSQRGLAGDLGTIVFRPNGDEGSARTAVLHTLKALLPPGSDVHVTSWVEDYKDALVEEHYFSVIFAMLGLSSLVLGAAGLFSVISYIANQRMREFAVRIALGAPGRSVIQLVMKDALVMALGGTAIGAGAGMWCGFMLWNVMWGVYPVDAGALIGAEAVLIAVTMLSCMAPALKAARSDPLAIIRAS